MRTQYAPLALLTLLLSTSTAAQQVGEFVSQADALGLVAETMSGMDTIGSSPMFGWSQSGIALGVLSRNNHTWQKCTEFLLLLFHLFSLVQA